MTKQQQNQKPLDIAGEEQELYSICSGPVVALYKFFDMVQVDLGDEHEQFATISFSHCNIVEIMYHSYNKITKSGQIVTVW